MPDSIAPTPAPPAVTPTPRPSGTVPREAPQAAAPPPPAPPSDDARLAEAAALIKRAAHDKMRVAKEKDAWLKERATKDSEAAKEREEFAAWRKSRDDVRLNPAKYLESEFGPAWYDKLTEVKINGTPPTDIIASELETRMSAMRKEMEEREAKWRKDLEERDVKLTEAEAKRAQDAHASSVLDYVRTNAEKYPLIAEFKEEGTVLRAIKEHWEATAKQDEEGNWEGEVLTAEQACVLIEKRIDEIAERAVKLKTASASKTVPAPTKPPAASGKSNTPPQRHAQPTNEAAPAKDDAERRARAIAAWNAVRAANS